jgi:hypothetical protein
MFSIDRGFKPYAIELLNCRTLELLGSRVRGFAGAIGMLANRPFILSRELDTV